jgi:CDP-paratose 2-epimerase
MGTIDQGVVVLWMARHFWKNKLSYVGYGGTGKQLRDMIHIKDLFSLIDLQIHQEKKFAGQTFNIGGTNKVSASLQELTTLCHQITGNKILIDAVPETRKADIRLYISDCHKIQTLSQWEPMISVEEILQDIFLWIKDNERQLKPILN